MVISYLGGQNFKISQGDLTISYNPPAKGSAVSASKFGADIALLSFDHQDFNGAENARFGEREPFVIEGPGEYEVRGVSVRGFGSPAEYGGKKSVNTIYSVALEGMNLCFLGVQKSADLPQTAKQELDDIDILFLPVGSAGLSVADGYKLAVGLEPKLIVPVPENAATLKSFLKEAGAEDTKPSDKLTLKKKDLDGKEGEIVVLSQ